MRNALSRTLFTLALGVLTGPLLAVPGAAAAPAAAGTTAASAPAAAAPRAETARKIAYRQFTSNRQLRKGTLRGVRVQAGSLVLDQPVGSRRYADPHGNRTKRYELGHWTSPVTSPGFGLTELVASWGAQTPRDSWIQVQVRGTSESGDRSSWDVLGRWAAGDTRFHRTSTPLGAESDDLAKVDVDTWKSLWSMEFTSYQLRVTLFRKAGTRATPTVETIGAVASNLPAIEDVPTSRPGVAGGIVLKVPRYSQMTHRDHHKQFADGGEAWCSPTSTSMVLGYYDRLPAEADTAWVGEGHRDRYVDHAARMTYDYEYGGTGNWSFATAYAAGLADAAFVTRLRSLTEAERFIAAGIPVIASIAFRSRSDLAGAPIDASNGHLLVIVGFTETGDVVVNDPAAPRNKKVRRTYDRGQFEDAWLPTSGGLAYIITADTPLPARNGLRNW